MHTSCHAAAIDLTSLDSLDKRFQQFSAEFYPQLISHKALPLVKYTSVTELKEAVDKYMKLDHPVHALSLIHYNLATLRNQIDSLEVVALTGLLLDYNDRQTANRLFKLAQLEAGRPAIANLSFEFAKYYLHRKQWQQTLEHLDGIINDLSVENADYARLMTGTILQHRKQHRLAVKYYQQIKPGSRHYPTAVLNTAIAYIRQDWWTDAQVLINKLLSGYSDKLDKQMVDRLNLVLGYALLRKEYFRNSRDAFRNVSLHGPYTNKALLGIALTAVNQQDFVGALNALTRLKEERTPDLPVDESYLLLAYTYGKLKQHLTATSAYNDAIQYYQDRIAQLERLESGESTLSASISIEKKTRSVHMGQTSFSYAGQYPEGFFNNYTHLHAMQPQISHTTSALTQRYQALLKDYKQALVGIGRHLLAERREFLQSYLNQSRYGLARLYDSSLVSTQ